MLSHSFRRATGPALRRISVKPVSIPTFAVISSRHYQSLPPTNPRHRPRSILSTPIQIRHCSAHRKMCRGTDTSGTVQVPDREILPANVKALHYDLTLEPNFKDFTFDGVVDIE